MNGTQIQNMFKKISKDYYNKIATKLDLLLLPTEGIPSELTKRSLGDIYKGKEQLYFKFRIKEMFLIGMRYLQDEIKQKTDLDDILLCEITTEGLRLLQSRIETPYKNFLNLLTEENIKPTLEVYNMCELAKQGIIDISDDHYFDDMVDQDMEFWYKIEHCFGNNILKKYPDASVKF